MGIYKAGKTWCIDENGFYQSGFASRDAARKFNADRKAGNESATTAVKAVKERPLQTKVITGYPATDIKVDRGTEGKWFFIHKITGEELQAAASRDSGRALLTDLRNRGTQFIPNTAVSVINKINTDKPTTVVNTPPVVKTQKPVISQVKSGPLACVKSTGISAYRNGRKFTVGRQPHKGTWKIKVNGAHIGTVYTSYEDACEACKYIMANKILSI